MINQIIAFTQERLWVSIETAILIHFQFYFGTGEGVTSSSYGIIKDDFLFFKQIADLGNTFLDVIGA